MPIAILEEQGRVPIHLWTPPGEVEETALRQLKNTASLPWAYHHVAVMPDVHFGLGATVGSVLATKGALCPAAVGVDIGCGMAALRSSLRAEDLTSSLRDIRFAIEGAIPVGFAEHKEPLPAVEHLKLWREFQDLTPAVRDLLKKAMRQCGTLGGGNHFIELCLDEEGRLWLMLHSGSRHIGKVLAEVHIGIAKGLAPNRRLPDPDLAAFLAGTPEMAAYRRDLFWAQAYAFANREAMVGRISEVLRRFFPQIRFDPPILCHHNYVAEELHFGETVLITRKGAIRAGKGEWGIIPGSMGTASYIVQGLGNPDAFESASHGAGRRMSRHAAMKRFSLHDLEHQTRGVECRKDHGVLDEIPGAYKDIDDVMRNQADLVEIRFQLKQVLCVKG